MSLLNGAAGAAEERISFSSRAFSGVGANQQFSDTIIYTERGLNASRFLIQLPCFLSLPFHGKESGPLVPLLPHLPRKHGIGKQPCRGVCDFLNVIRVNQYRGVTQCIGELRCVAGHNGQAV